MRRAALVVTTSILAAALPAAVCAQQGAGSAEERARLEAEMRAPRPIGGYDSVWLEELTWMEVRDALAAGTKTAIIATGGIEQNGPYLALGKHNYVLQGACEGIARSLGNALCAPLVKYVPEGDIDVPTGHMRYPGTISLTEATFEAMLTDIASSLKQHGFTDIVLIGDSGGNQTGMQNVANALNARWSDARAHFIPEFYRYADAFAWMKSELGIEEPMNEGIHDDYVITSIMFANDPTTVRFDQRVAAGKASINGLSLVPAEHTAEVGRKLLGFRVDQTVKAIRASMAAARTGG